MNAVKQKFVLRFCVVALAWTYADSVSCPSAVNGQSMFGPTCQYVCHCAGGLQCDGVTGECPDGCEGNWFGTGCQYSDTALNVRSRHLDNKQVPNYSNLANDGDVTTCSYTNLASTGSSRVIPPYWIIFYQQLITFPEGYEISLKLNSEHLDDFKGYKIFIENYPDDKICGDRLGCRHHIPSDRQLCYQHDGSVITSTTLTVTCDRTLEGNSLRVELRDNYTQLVLCDIKISLGRNLALKKTTSSIPNTDTASSAVDGSEKTCTLIQGTDQWWEVDLGFEAQINYICIKQSSLHSLNDAHVKGRNDGELFNIRSFNEWQNTNSFITSSKARHIRVSSQYKIGICEVYIFGECPSMSWGESCQYDCGHCYNGSLCDPRYGTCKKGCSSGYKNTSFCTAECDDNTYGQNCGQTCSWNCANVCNKVNGTCTCRAGWQGLQCAEECDNIKYGQGCQETCSTHCSNVCNKVDGTCSCTAGWNGSRCTEECDDGTYGLGCRENCGHCRRSSCGKVNGYCSDGCLPGWKGSKCNIECDDNKYGQNCGQTCSWNCANICNKVNGTCSCKAGWKGSNCTEECDDGKYGSGCQYDCGHCQGSSCNKTDGHCAGGCQPGWQGSNCDQDCDNYKYGQNCSQTCSVNCGNVCDKVHGTCTCRAGWQGSLCKEECDDFKYGQNCNQTCSENCEHVCNKTDGRCSCKAGWHGPRCTQTCSEGFYGDNCLATCGQCSDECHHVNGTCLDGCKEGFTGDLCMVQLSRPDPASTGPAVGGSAGSIVVLAVVIVAVVIIRGRRRAKPIKRQQFDNIQVEIENRKVSKTDQTQTTSRTEPVGAISNAVYSNTESPEDGLYYNSGPLQREPMRTGIHPIAVSEFRTFVRERYVNDELFQQEFDKIPYGLQHPAIVASEAGKSGKNRYKEMYAYDHSRVILRKIADEPHSDYINACHIDGFKEEKRYIASQGPVNPMVGDFWRLVWEQDVHIIVMVTNLVEEGKMKCLKYWGESTPTIHGTFAVTLLEIKEYSDYIIRTIRLHEQDKPNVSRTVTQFNYTTWPDKSVPTSSTSLVNFWRKVRSQKRKAKQTWLVHCSAGVGRTGTFIAMDVLFDQGKDTGTVDIPQCVTNLRWQRVNMVQTAGQFRYLYKLMLEMLVLPADPVSAEQLTGANTGLKKQYQDLCSEGTLYPDDASYKSASANENQSKNRSMDILAADEYRPYLSSNIPDTTNYINAVVMPSYKLPTRFIITQTPLRNTLVDFCRLIFEKEIQLIISFDDSKEEEVEFFPDEGETKSISGISLRGTSSEKTDGSDFYTRSFDLKFKQKTHQFTQVVYTGWTQKKTLPQSARSFVDILRHTRNVAKSETPIVAQCLNGADRSGLFIVLWNILEHLDSDGEVSIPRIIRHLRLRRKQIIPNFEQFKFCADCIRCFCEEETSNTYANL